MDKKKGTDRQCIANPFKNSAPGHIRSVYNNTIKSLTKKNPYSLYKRDRKRKT